MNKLDELMELNKSVDTIINSAMEDNKKTEEEIIATKIELWNKMWDDIDAWYNKGYVNAAINNISNSSINTMYGYKDSSLDNYRTADIKLYKHPSMMPKPWVYLDVIGGHKRIERDDYSLFKHEYHGKCITVLLLNWEKTKNKIEQKLVNSIAENIKRKTKATEDIINNNNTTLEALKSVLKGENK